MTMDPQHEETKKFITSILTSSPNVCTIRILCKDFQELVGYPIPFQKFGYSNIEQYLNSIPDTVRVMGSGPNAELRMIIKEKSAHINELVRRQRKKRGPRTHNIPRNRMNTSRYNRRPPRRVYRPPDNSPPRSVLCAQQPCVLAPPPPPSDTDTDSDFDELPPTPLPIQPKNNVINSSASVVGNQINIPDEIIRNFKSLMKDFPNGILTDDFMTEYENRFKTRIPYENFRFLSLTQMCNELPDIFKIIKKSSCDYLLLDANASFVDVEEIRLDNLTTDYFNDEVDVTPLDMQNELLALRLDWDVAPTFVPPNVLHLNDRIERYFISDDIEEGMLMDIVVAEIYDLSKFYVYDPHGGLRELQNELKLFYSINSNRIPIPEIYQNEGLYCVATFMGDYHRAVIVNLLSDVPGKIRVLYIDYGTVANVLSSQVWYLNTAFGSLPSQAIRAGLSKLQPPTEDTPWSLDAKNRFRELLKGRDICGEIMKIDRENKILELYIADLTDEDGNIFYINDVLVNEQLASYTNEQPDTIDFGSSTPKVERIYQFPTFCEIEKGLVANAFEVAAMLRQNISVDHYLRDYYYDDDDLNERITEIENDHEEYLRSPIESSKDIVKTEFDTKLFFSDDFSKELERVMGKSALQSESDGLSSIRSDFDEKDYSGFCNRARLDELRKSVHDNKAIVLNNQNDEINKTAKNLSDLNLVSNDPVIVNQINAIKKNTNPFLNCDIPYEEVPIRLNPNNPFLYPLYTIEDTIQEANVFEICAKKDSNITDNNLATNCQVNESKVRKSKIPVLNETVNRQRNDLIDETPIRRPPPGFEHMPPNGMRPNPPSFNPPYCPPMMQQFFRTTLPPVPFVNSNSPNGPNWNAPPYGGNRNALPGYNANPAAGYSVQVFNVYNNYYPYPTIQPNWPKK